MSFLMMGRDMRAMEPTELLFWGVMSLGVIAGFTMAYPWNVWMVKSGLKHGLMTERKPGTQFDLQNKPAGETEGAPHEHRGHEHHAQPAGGHAEGGHEMKSDITPAQLAAVASVSLVALAVGMIAPMDRDTPAEAMIDMAAVTPRDIVQTYGLDVHGNRESPSHMEDGVKVFELETAVIRWTILPGVTVDAYAFNGQVPGPRLHFRKGDRVRINVRNRLPESTTVHWHGLILPNIMDGPAHITQEPIASGGGLYRYEFTAVQSGTYLYHSHDHIDRQQALGLYGALIIDPATPDPSLEADHEYDVLLQEWLMREGLTYPAMPMDGAQPNYFTINGRAYPATDRISMRLGETLKVRFIGSSNGFIHPMHIHGGPFQVVAVDGNTLQPSARYQADTVNVGPGQRYDVIWLARQPGKWLIHCHIGHHTTNNNVETQGGGGLMVVIDVASR
jgi:FtsP/CotA-like multicopper oxidase with cupredoxin domain